jgi:hypothetical protein
MTFQINDLSLIAFECLQIRHFSYRQNAIAADGHGLDSYDGIESAFGGNTGLYVAVREDGIGLGLGALLTEDLCMTHDCAKKIE